MKAEDGTNSKLDMTLDEIIKLNQKEARKNQRIQQTTAPRGRRLFTKSSQKLRVSAAGNRLRRLKQKRLSRNNRPPPESTAQHQFSRKNKRVFTAKNVRPNRAAALAVLRRAQRTAAAAAKTAADATALLQRNRVRRQQLFDERRSIQTTRIAYERRPSGRRNAPVTVPGSRAAYDTSRVIGRTWQTEQRSQNFQRRLRRRPRQTMGIPQSRRTSFRGSSSSNGPSLISSSSGNQRWSNRSTFRGNGRGRQRSTYTLQTNNRTVSRARNAEYLAQARALIRAQHEHVQRYRSNDAPRISVWPPTSHSAPHRNLNYYAKYWDN
uniref:Uncharacterized protein n=1 Tax=Trichobilharzia regenti TaxID=157069 RepID=A0AA85J3L3_TRIRE|nr:unnamed protein product [Trichobilharzia regenti]